MIKCICCRRLIITVSGKANLQNITTPRNWREDVFGVYCGRQQAAFSSVLINILWPKRSTGVAGRGSQQNHWRSLQVVALYTAEEVCKRWRCIPLKKSASGGVVYRWSNLTLAFPWNRPAMAAWYILTYRRSKLSEAWYIYRQNTLNLDVR
jgi:hypothetical protein